MRLWSLHPEYLDARGLVAAWREGLLAQKVLEGKTKGYRNHPQLHRFRAMVNPAGAMARYLECIADEADRRGYHFNRDKIGPIDDAIRMTVTRGQIDYERTHLLSKLKTRDPQRYDEFYSVEPFTVHPIFDVVEGGIEEWEKT